MLDSPLCREYHQGMVRFSVALLLIPLALVQNADDFKAYTSVAEWTGNASYSLEATWDYTDGGTRQAGEEIEHGMMVLHLDQFNVKTGTTVEWLGMGSTQAWRRSKAGSYSKDSYYETSKTVSTSFPSKGWLLMDFPKGTFNLNAKSQSFPCEQTIRRKSNLGESTKGEKVTWVPQTMATVFREPLPKPSPGMFLSGSKTDQDTHHVNIGSSKGRLSFTALWTLAPVWRDIELVVRVDDYERWLPEGGKDGRTPGSLLNLHAELRSKDGKPLHLGARKIRFELMKTSKEKGVCLNWPPSSGDDAFDFRFIPGATSLPEDDQFQKVMTVAIGNPITQASAAVGCYDWGAAADLRATAELEDGRVVVGHLDGQQDRIHVPLPKRQPHSKVADSWKTSHGHPLEEDDAWDEDAAPKPAKVKGDGLTLYEEYRGAFLKDGNHARLNPDQMELFVLDPDQLLDLPLWKKITATAALPLTSDQHLQQRVNFNSDGKPKYVLSILKVKGVADPEGSANDTIIWGQTDAMIADTAARSRIFVDRPENGLKNTLHVKVKNALADPQSPDGQLLYGDGLTKPMLEGADRALSDPSVLGALTARLVKWVVLHEVAHACAIDDHLPDKFKGDVSCVMRNLDGHDKMFRMAQELITPSPGPLPLGIDKLCSAPHDCWGQLRLKPK